jgi:hypothetical protein
MRLRGSRNVDIWAEVAYRRNRTFAAFDENSLVNRTGNCFGGTGKLEARTGNFRPRGYVRFVPATIVLRKSRTALLWVAAGNPQMHDRSQFQKAAKAGRSRYYFGVSRASLLKLRSSIYHATLSKTLSQALSAGVW